MSFAVFEEIERLEIESGSTPALSSETEKPRVIDATSLDDVSMPELEAYVLWEWSESGPRMAENPALGFSKSEELKCMCHISEDMRCDICSGGNVSSSSETISFQRAMAASRGSDNPALVGFFDKVTSVVYQARPDDKYNKYEIDSIEKIDKVSGLSIDPEVREYAKSVFRTIRNFNVGRTILRGTRALGLLVACVYYAFIKMGHFCPYDSLCTAFGLTKNRQVVTKAFGTVSIIMSFLNERPLHVLSPQAYVSSICSAAGFRCDALDVVMATKLVYAMKYSGFSESNLTKTLSTFAVMIVYGNYAAEKDAGLEKFFAEKSYIKTSGDVIRHVNNFTEHSSTTICVLFSHLNRDVGLLEKFNAVEVLDDADYEDFSRRYGVRGERLPVHDVWADTRLRIRDTFPARIYREAGKKSRSRRKKPHA